MIVIIEILVCALLVLLLIELIHEGDIKKVKVKTKKVQKTLTDIDKEHQKSHTKRKEIEKENAKSKGKKRGTKTKK
jgi:F0F1-type ATP synthase membrane subunit b/b'